MFAAEFKRRLSPPGGWLRASTACRTDGAGLHGDVVDDARDEKRQQKYQRYEVLHSLEAADPLERAHGAAVRACAGRSMTRRLDASRRRRLGRNRDPSISVPVELTVVGIPRLLHAAHVDYIDFVHRHLECAGRQRQLGPDAQT